MTGRIEWHPNDIGNLTAAMEAYRQRVEYFCEQIATASDPDAEPHSTYPDVIANEAYVLVVNGPTAYLRMVGDLADAATRADLDRQLRVILGEGGDR